MSFSIQSVSSYTPSVQSHALIKEPRILAVKQSETSNVSFGADPISLGIMLGIAIPSLAAVALGAVAGEFFVKRGVMFGFARWFGKGNGLRPQTTKDFLPIMPYIKKAEEYLGKAVNSAP